MFKTAIAAQASLGEAGHEIDMSVNVSGRTLGEADFADFALAQNPAQRSKLTPWASGRVLP